MLDTTDCTTTEPCERNSKGETIYCPWHYRDIFCYDPIIAMRRDADQQRFLLEMRLNSIFTTWKAGMGLDGSNSTFDMVDTFSKYRAMGAIK